MFLPALRIGFRVLSAASPGLAARIGARMWFTPSHLTLREDGRAFLATGERSTIVVNGRDVVRWAWGSGPTVVLMHGWGGLGVQMQPFVAPLVQAGYRVVIFDAPSHGASAPGHLGGRRVTLFEFADTLRAASADTGEVAGVVAHSGGATAAAWAIARGDAPPRRLVLISPMASPLRYLKLFQRTMGLSDRAMRMFREDTEREFRFRWVDLEVPPMASRVETPPVLVIHDRDDAETAWSEGAAIADAWPQSALMTTTGLGHRRILRDAAVVEAVTRFIDSAVP
jgi:pimeloyl-ACP methyl ester carboxylesterase